MNLSPLPVLISTDQKKDFFNLLLESAKLILRYRKSSISAEIATENIPAALESVRMARSIPDFRRFPEVMDLYYKVTLLCAAVEPLDGWLIRSFRRQS